MSYFRRVINTVIYDAEEEQIPKIEPYRIKEGRFQGETARTLVQKGVDGLFTLSKILLNEPNVNVYDCANSVIYELRRKARKILEMCDDDTYGRYFCALFELFNVMPGRSYYCVDFVREYCEEEDYENESTFDFVYFDEPFDHEAVLDKIITDLEKYPVFVYESEVEVGEISLDGKANVFPGMHVKIALSEGQESEILEEGVIEEEILEEGIVAEVLTKTMTDPQGIEVRLMHGKIGRIKEILN